MAFDVKHELQTHVNHPKNYVDREQTVLDSPSLKKSDRFVRWGQGLRKSQGRGARAVAPD